MPPSGPSLKYVATCSAIIQLFIIHKLYSQRTCIGQNNFHSGSLQLKKNA